MGTAVVVRCCFWQPNIGNCCSAGRGRRRGSGGTATEPPPAAAAAAAARRRPLTSTTLPSPPNSIPIITNYIYLFSSSKDSSSSSFLHSATTPNNTISRASPPPPSSSSLDTDPPEAVDAEGPDSGIGEPGKSKVNVRFVLHRKCKFGERFFVIGEDPVFGSWEPSAAVPMEWSEGHVWTTDKEIPCGTIFTKFKYLLKGVTGEIFWQPGVDRTFSVWETDKTIVIMEDWESAELQKLSELDSQQLDGLLSTEPPPPPPPPPIFTSAADQDVVVVMSDTHDQDCIISMTEKEYMEETTHPVLVPGLSSSSTSFSNSAIGTPAQQAENENEEMEAPLDYAESKDGGKHDDLDINVPEERNSSTNRNEEGTVWSRGFGNLQPAVAILKNDVEWSLQYLAKLWLGFNFNQLFD